MTVIDTPTLLRILAEAAGEDPDLQPTDVGEASMTDLGFDSLVLIEAATQLEREFGLRIPEDRLAGVTTVADLRDLANEFVPEGRPS
jgi:minimal PKS acyl carrier protein